ncbi:3-deoxy-D-manno-octulosonic-acid transferase [Roseibium sp. TrichSKD4]|uniref:3-deoxy-D-manno-octulosonic acid transferase n=1 Tax=Roseibium sp. TrichSKD4 TaxID=744980 RepID=UPI0001E56277|nr:3-deoxy-D-manno-octulosonic acid transferase [Roseibium sp. TrichSKD4]EFO34489.1 3-deoxy-D-manno-octulosonic-acid transferase [Roseibium sp. TrichSKD4]
MAEKRPLPVKLYLGLTRLGEPLYSVLHKKRIKKGKDDPLRSGERFGEPGQTRPEGTLVWVHAASVGETNSVLPLIEALAEQGHTVLLTTVTMTSAEIAVKQLPDRAVHQYAPFDSPRLLESFLNYWQPSVALFVESEIWPGTLAALKERNCPTVLVNGRMSQRSFRGWGKAPSTAGFLFGAFDLAMAQSPHDGERLQRLGCKRVECPGNLKFDSVVPDPSFEEVARLKAAIGSRKVWLAALTHPGEEESAFAAHLDVRDRHPGGLLMLVPRHPDRRAEIATLAKEYGLSVSQRSKGALPALTDDVYLGDTLGEMGLFYSLAPIAFLGGSLTDRGGHNPLEAIQFDTALITGPHVANAKNTYRDLWTAGAARKIPSADKLAEEVNFLLENEAECASQIANAHKIIENGRGALVRVMKLIEPYLPSTGR